MKVQKTNEYRKRKQAKSGGLLPHTNHRSHVSGKRWLRVWEKRRHVDEMRELKGQFESALKLTVVGDKHG